MVITDKNWPNIKEEEIIKPLALKYNISEKEVSYIYDHIFKSLKKTLQLKEVPRVFLHNLGTFEANIYALNKRLREWIRRYQNCSISKTELKEKLWTLIPVRNRIKKELKSRTFLHRKKIT